MDTLTDIPIIMNILTDTLTGTLTDTLTGTPMEPLQAIPMFTLIWLVILTALQLRNLIQLNPHKRTSHLARQDLWAQTLKVLGSNHERETLLQPIRMHLKTFSNLQRKRLH